MHTIKEKVINTIKKLPDNANYDDIMESIYVQQMISEGIKQLDNGEFVSHDEVKERFREWLR
jgi:predicted transcriptional regulator